MAAPLGPVTAPPPRATGRSPLQVLLLALLWAYRTVVSPWFGPVCRYHPTCSTYAVQAITVHGGVRGGWLAMRRLGRCHPWSPGGLDFVPDAGAYRWWGRAAGTDAPRPTTKERQTRLDMPGAADLRETGT